MYSRLDSFEVTANLESIELLSREFEVFWWETDKPPIHPAYYGDYGLSLIKNMKGQNWIEFQIKCDWRIRKLGSHSIVTGTFDRALVRIKRFSASNHTVSIELWDFDSDEDMPGQYLGAAVSEKQIRSFFDAFHKHLESENFRPQKLSPSDIRFQETEGSAGHDASQRNSDISAEETSSKQTLDLHVDTDIKTRDAQYVFRKKGDVWEIAYRGGDEFHIKGIKGMNFIAYLLAKPNREIGVLELVAAVEKHLPPETPYRKMSEVELDDAGLPMEVLEDDAVLDREAFGQYKERLIELDDGHETATAIEDYEALIEIEAEKEKIVKELKAAKGLGRRPRKFSSKREKARSNVQQRIKGAVSIIREHDVELAEHLDKTINTGMYCVYKPSSSITWQT